MCINSLLQIIYEDDSYDWSLIFSDNEQKINSIQDIDYFHEAYNDDIQREDLFKNLKQTLIANRERFCLANFKKAIKILRKSKYFE